MRPWNHPICGVCGQRKVWVGDPDSESVRKRMCPRCDSITATPQTGHEPDENGQGGPAVTAINEWALGVAEQVEDQIAHGFSWFGLVLPEHFGRRFGYSKAQARHILNRAAERGAIEKVRLTSLGHDAASAGAHFGYRPKVDS